MLRKIFYLTLAIVFTFDSAYGWQENKTEIFPLACEKLIKNGAERLFLEVTAKSGSYGVPYLVGSKDGKNIWRKRFPADEVNLAKFEYSCNDNKIIISHANPMVDTYKYQTFIWDGEFIEKRVADGKGSRGWSVYKKTSPNQSDRFRLWAKKGQKISVEMQNIYAPSVFKIYAPDSTIPVKEIIFAKKELIWNTTLNKTGDYIIVIEGTKDDSLYYVKLWIN